MHLHRRIGGLIRRGELRFHGGRGRGAGQGHSDDLAHRILAGGREKQRGVAPRSRRWAIGAKSFQHCTRRPNTPLRIQYGKPGFFFGFEKPAEGIRRCFAASAHAAAPARPRKRQT